MSAPLKDLLLGLHPGRRHELMAAMIRQILDSLADHFLMKLQANYSVLYDEALIFTSSTGANQLGALGNIESIAMPVKCVEY